MDEICRECGLCEFSVLARKRDEARLLFEWICKMIIALVKEASNETLSTHR